MYFLPDLICFPESSCFESVETFIGLKYVCVLPEMCGWAVMYLYGLKHLPNLRLSLNSAW
jgi:hypothetical protein